MCMDLRMTFSEDEENYDKYRIKLSYSVEKIYILVGVNYDIQGNIRDRYESISY